MVALSICKEFCYVHIFGINFSLAVTLRLCAAKVMSCLKLEMFSIFIVINAAAQKIYYKVYVIVV